MRIVVVGDGKVGHTLAETLAGEGHDIVVVDRSEDALQRSEDTLDVMCVHGNGANAQTLLAAGAAKADMMIAATASDETNMLCCLVSKKLGTRRAVARIRDPEFHESLSLLQKDLDIDMAINPEYATALEISRLLRFPFADSIESFAKGRVEMVEFHAHEKDIIVGYPMKVLHQKLHGIPRVLYCAVERGDDVIIPGGDFVIQPDDRVHVAADAATITAFFRFLGKNTGRVKDVMLLGGSRISYYLAKLIIPLGIHVSIIENNEEKAAELSEILTDANIILGDGTDQELLSQESLEKMDAFITLSNRDEDNFITALYALNQGVRKVIVKNNRVAYMDIFGTMGLDSIISPKSITSDVILRYVRALSYSEGATAVEKLYRLMGGKAEALEFMVQSSAPYIGIPLRNLTTRANTLVAVIVRKGKVIIPFGDDHIEGEDIVIIITLERGIGHLDEVILR